VKKVEPLRPAKLKKNTICLLVLVLDFILWLGNPLPAFGQAGVSPEDSDGGSACSVPQSAFLSVGTNRSGTADVPLNFCTDASRENEVRRKISKAFDCPSGRLDFSEFRDGGMAGITANCTFKLPQRMFELTGEMKLLPIRNVLKLAGVETLVVLVVPPPHGTTSCEPPSEMKQSSPVAGKACIYMLEASATGPGEIRYAFGYEPSLMLRDISILVLLLLIPIALTIRFRSLAQRIPEESKPAVVFSYFRFIRWTVLAGVLLWWTVIDVLHLDHFLQFFLTTSGMAAVDNAVVASWILLWLPPVIIYFFCLALSTPIHALRGVSRTQTQAISQSFWAVARFVLPLSLLILGVVEFSSSPRLAVLLIVAAVAASQVTRRMFAKSYGMELHALTAGELRDRAFAIAKKAGTKLNQLYVLPTEQIRMANAYAHAANNIFLTDYLVKNLNKREVDAIIGHEMAHLQKKHVRSRILVLVFWAAGIAFASIWFGNRLPSGFPAGPAFYAFLLLAIFIVSRSNEFAADAGAFKLTGNAEAMITAFAKLSRLNTMPLHWGRVDEQMLTHPSTMRRIKRIARAGKIPETRLPELLSQATAPPADAYLIPRTALPSGKIFSTQFKSRLSSSIAWIIILTTVLIPVLTVQVILWTHPLESVRAIAFLLGIALTIAFQLWLSNILPFWKMPRLERELREKVRRAGAPPQVSSGLFVSLAPDSGPRVYELNWAWDIGLLAITEGSLFYWGEEARFTLRREQIVHISLGPGPVGWFRTQAAYISWKDETGTVRKFNFRLLGALSMREMARKTITLADELDKWHRGIQFPSKLISLVGKPGGPIAEGPGLPAFGQVTGLPPRDMARGGRLVRIFMFDTVIAIGVFILLGFPAPLLSTASPQSTLGDLNLLSVVFLYVLAAVWIARAVTLWPYWRYRERKSETVAI
jgi:Zn-dependent protease with chaperone function